MLSNFFKATFRNLWNNKIYSTLNIFGLAIGIASVALIFLWVEDELTFDNINVKKDRLYQLNVNIVTGGNNFTMGSTPRPMGKAIQAEIPGIVNTARISDQDQRLLFNYENKSFYAIGRFADPSLFGMFTFNFIEGNAKNAFPQLYSLVITETAANKFFGNEKNVVGKILRVDNNHDYVVSGVVKDLPENSTLQFEWLAPYEVTVAETHAKGDFDDSQYWGSYGPFTYVELAKNANLNTIDTQLKNFIHRKSADQKSETFLFPMSQWRLYSEFANGKPTGGGRITQVRLLAIIAWIILLIACINFMNLATANSQKRAREIEVRKVLGAGKKKLVIQFLGEALLMAVIAALVSILIISLSLPAFNLLMQKQLSLHLGDRVHLIALSVTTVICGLIAGSYPSLYLSSFNPVFVLKGSKMKAGSASMIRKGLVVFQFAVSIIFIISTLIVYMQIQHVKNRNLGFNRDNLVEIDPQHDISRIFPLIKNDLLQSGVIQNVALSDHTTLYGGDTDNGFKWQGKLPDNQVSIAHRNVSPEFIATSALQIVEGRDFTDNAALESSNVIINESMAKMMGKESAVGKIIQSPRGYPDGIFKNMTVVGVVKDYVFGNIYGTAAPLIIFCQPLESQTFLYVRIKTKEYIEEALAKIKAVMKKNNPAYPLEYKFVDDQFNEMFSNETQISKVSTIFAVLAIVISCLGLFGLATYTAESRIKEIGIRKVLGASVLGITGLLSKDFLRLVIIACLLAFPISWWIMHNWLMNYEYRITIAWWLFLVAGLAAILIASLTIAYQAIKTAIVNPVTSLRSE